MKLELKPFCEFLQLFTVELTYLEVLLDEFAKNGRYPPTQNGDIRSLLALFRQKSLQN